MEIDTIGIDLGKTVFHVVGLNGAGEVLVRRRAGQQAGSLRLGGAGQKRSLSATDVGVPDGGTGLQLTPGKSQAWKSLKRFPQSQPSGDGYSKGFLPGLLANSEMAKWSNPALSKPVIRKSPLRLRN